jgi:hypothetical protein
MRQVQPDQEETMPRRPIQGWILLITALVLLAALAGCGRSWQATITAPDGSPFVVNRQVLEGLADFAEEGQGIPLEQVLWQAGHQAVERLVATGPDGVRREYEWADVADDAWWPDAKRDKLSIAGETFAVSRLEVEPPALLSQVQAHITDIAPTVAAVLGLPAPAQATGQALKARAAHHALLLFLDGLGYVRYTQAQRDGLTPNLAALGEPLLGLTTYPPVTNVSTASLLTGAPPQVHGADRRGVRQTEAETLFDVASAAGMRVVAVEGESLPFNLRNAELQLSGDRDGNGSTDDNVLAHALAALEGGMPDLLYVHFHGIDDAGHTYGPSTPQESAVIQEVDAAVGQILAALPPDTFIVIFADHGMHRVEEEGELGNHGHLIEQDMFIPIWLVGK